MPAPLEGRRILITRSRTQASVLAAELQEFGAVPISIPTIEFAPPASFAALDHALVALPRFDWVIFTSANAVDAFAERARLLGVTPVPQRLAAIGSATAHALLRAGIHPAHPPVLLPPVAVAESLADILFPVLARHRAEKGAAEVLLVRAEQARDVLPEALLAAGVALTLAPAYRNVLPQSSAGLLQAAFASETEKLDAITFTSSSTARNLVALLEASGLHLPAGILRISIGPITTETLRELGIPPHFEALEANIPSLVQAVLQAFTPAAD